jgi:hypothetical protein
MILNGIGVLDCETEEHVRKWDKVVCVSGWRVGVTMTGFSEACSWNWGIG